MWQNNTAKETTCPRWRSPPPHTGRSSSRRRRCSWRRMATAERCGRFLLPQWTRPGGGEGDRGNVSTRNTTRRMHTGRRLFSKVLPSPPATIPSNALFYLAPLWQENCRPPPTRRLPPTRRPPQREYGCSLPVRYVLFLEHKIVWVRRLLLVVPPRLVHGWKSIPLVCVLVPCLPLLLPHPSRPRCPLLRLLVALQQRR